MTGSSPAFDPSSAVCVGRVLVPHGLRGELKVESLTDFPERFRAGARLWLRGEPRRVRSSRWQGRAAYLQIEGVEDRTAAEALRGEELYVPRAMAIRAPDVYYQHDIVGLRVETSDGETLGGVESIFATGANDVFVVRSEQGELLLPAIDDVIKQVDLEGGRVVVELLPGLEFTPAPRVARQRRD